MSVFNKNKTEKKAFAFTDPTKNEQNTAPKNFDDFVNSGVGDSKNINSQNKIGAKRGRPKFKEEEKMLLVSIYMRQDQKEIVAKKAREANMPISNFIVSTLFKAIESK